MSINSPDKMEDLGLEAPSIPFIRRIESLSRRKIATVLFLFIVCNIIIVVSLIFGPDYYLSQHMDFKVDPLASTTRRISFDFSGLKYWNDFLNLDLRLFLEQTYAYDITFNISLYFMATMNRRSSTENTILNPTHSLPIMFKANSNVTDPIRVFSSKSVRFDSLHALVTIKFPDQVSLPGQFDCSFADPAHSIVQIVLRFAFFFVSIIVFVLFLVSDFSFKVAPISMKIMYLIDIVMIIASDPLFILAYFSESSLIHIIDACINLFFIICVAYNAFSVLLMSGLKHRDVTMCWIIVRFIPFLFGFGVFAASAIYSAIVVGKDPMTKSNQVSKALNYTKIALASVYLLSVIYGIIRFSSDVAHEKAVFVLMSLVMFIVAVISELKNMSEEFLGSNYTIQIFTYLAVATYVLFFNYFNWPVDPSMALDNKDPDEVQVDGQNDLGVSAIRTSSAPAPEEKL